MPRIGTLEIDDQTKNQVMEGIEEYIKNKTPATIVTPYSEFVVMAEQQADFRNAINTADIKLADGVGIIWAGHYLNHSVGFFQSLFDLVRRPPELYQVFPEKISGSDLMYDLLALANSQSLRVFLLGSEENISATVAQKIQDKYPNIILTDRFSGKVSLDDTNLMDRIAKTRSDLVLIALSPPKQELWAASMKDYLIQKNLPGVLCCFGGTFDFFAGSKERAPKWMRTIGLEWLWRLIIEPRRIKRIYRATWVYINLIHGLRGTQSNKI